MRHGCARCCCADIRACGERAAFQTRYASYNPPASLALITPNPVRIITLLGIAKRAETRECPICGDHIPLRLLGQHFTLESSRVQTILDHIGDLDAFSDPHAPPHAPYVRSPYLDARFLTFSGLLRAAELPLLKLLTTLPSSLRASPRPSVSSNAGARHET